MAARLIRIGEFHEIQSSQLRAANQILEETLSRGNITSVLGSLEFNLPVREIVQNGKTEIFALLSGRMEPGDKVTRVRIT